MTPKAKKRVADLSIAIKFISKHLANLRGEKKRLLDRDRAMKAPERERREKAAAAQEAETGRLIFNAVIVDGQSIPDAAEAIGIPEQQAYADLHNYPSYRHQNWLLNGSYEVEGTWDESHKRDHDLEDAIAKICDAYVSRNLYQARDLAKELGIQHIAP